jgi:hypothetical protein
MFEPSELITKSYLVRELELNPNDERLQIYDAIQRAVAKIEPWGLLTITTRSPIYDRPIFEGLIRRFAHQTWRSVLGMRKQSRLPMLTILERNKKGILHAHILIGQIQGTKRQREDTTFKHYVQKQIFPSIVKVLVRLSYGVGRQNKLDLDSGGTIDTKHHKDCAKKKTQAKKRRRFRNSKRRSSRIGRCHCRSVYEPVRLVDYLLKGMRVNNFYAAWLATDLSFQGSDVVDCPECPKRPNPKRCKVNTQSSAPLKVP